jgi:zinc protease
MADRFTQPAAGSATPARFPAIAREVLASGVRLWSIPHATVPIVTVALVIDRGAADDPVALPGLAGLTADLVGEGADGLDAIELSDAFARLGSALAIDVGPDVTTLAFTTLARFFDPALALLARVVMRPHLLGADLTRVRELRLNRLRQLRSSAAAAAERVFVGAVFGEHAYGHGVLGTTSSLEQITLDDVTECHRRTFAPERATLLVAGDVRHEAVVRAAHAEFGPWPSRAGESTRGVTTGAPPPTVARVLVVDRPGAPQSELRIGHAGPPRRTDAYHALVVLNAVLGGQFASRINQNLRERRGYTYGARTTFDFRRLAGTFLCDTSVQANATAAAVAEVIAEFEAVRSARPVTPEELGRAASALTRGYVRNFETAGQLVGAAGQLATYALPDSTFDAFVPLIGAIREADVLEVARRFVRPDACVVVVVGDVATCWQPLLALGHPVSLATPVF